MIHYFFLMLLLQLFYYAIYILLIFFKNKMSLSGASIALGDENQACT